MAGCGAGEGAAAVPEIPLIEARGITGKICVIKPSIRIPIAPQPRTTAGVIRVPSLKDHFIIHIDRKTTACHIDPDAVPPVGLINHIVRSQFLHTGRCSLEQPPGRDPGPALPIPLEEVVLGITLIPEKNAHGVVVRGPHIHAEAVIVPGPVPRD